MHVTRHTTGLDFLIVVVVLYNGRIDRTFLEFLCFTCLDASVTTAAALFIKNDGLNKLVNLLVNLLRDFPTGFSASLVNFATDTTRNVLYFPF